MAEKPETPSQGQPEDVAKTAQEAQDSKAAAGKDKAAEKKAAPKPKAAKKEPKATEKPADDDKPATAAKKTKVDKKAADAVAEGETSTKGAAKDAEATKGKAKKAPAKTETAAKAKSDKPATKPSRRRRGVPEGSEAVVVRAHAKYVRSSARKARLVCDQIRGKSVPEARALLAFSPRDVAEAWTKLLESAVANAEHNHDLDGDDLKVLAVFADEGPTIKRFRPRAMGRATSIHKRTSHLTIQLTPKETR